MSLADAMRSMTLDFFGKGEHKIPPARLLDHEGAVLLDVRTPDEVETVDFGLGRHDKVAVLYIPLHELPERFEEIPRDRPVGIFCSGAVRSAIAYSFLVSKGFSNARIIVGGYTAMIESLMPGKVLAAVRGPG